MDGKGELIYNNEFDANASVSTAQAIALFARNEGSWAAGPSIGSTNNVFIEDCYFDMKRAQDQGIEMYRGARAVVRFNDFSGHGLGAHGLDSDALSVDGGSYSVEFYHNTYDLVDHINEPSTYHQMRSVQAIFFNNDYTATWQGGGAFTWYGQHVQLTEYRARSQNYSDGDIDGGFVIDGNAPEPTHGHYWHAGSDNASTLTVQTGLTTDALIGLWVYNYTDNSYGEITDNDASTITVTLSGGTDDDFDYLDEVFIGDSIGEHDGSNNASTLSHSDRSWTTDEWDVQAGVSTTPPDGSYELWNITDGSHGTVTANSSTTVTATLAGGTDNDWDSGDIYVLTFGYPARRMISRAGPEIDRTTHYYHPYAPSYNWSQRPQ